MQGERHCPLCACAKCHPVYGPLPTGVAVRLQSEPGVRAVALPLNELRPAASPPGPSSRLERKWSGSAGLVTPL